MSLVSLKVVALFNSKKKADPDLEPLPMFDIELFATIALVKKGST